MQLFARWELGVSFNYFCQWKRKQTFGNKLTSIMLLPPQEQIGHTGYITVWQENPFLDNFTHFHFFHSNFEIFCTEIVFLKLLCSHLSPHLHSQPFHAIGRLLGKKENQKQWLSTFPAKVRKRWRDTFFQFVVRFNKEAQLVCVWHQPMVPPSSASPSCTSESSCSRTPSFSPTHMSSGTAWGFARPPRSAGLAVQRRHRSILPARSASLAALIE